jgi:hypothetical protein
MLCIWCNQTVHLYKSPQTLQKQMEFKLSVSFFFNELQNVEIIIIQFSYNARCGC